MKKPKDAPAPHIDAVQVGDQSFVISQRPVADIDAEVQAMSGCSLQEIGNMLSTTPVPQLAGMAIKAMCDTPEDLTVLEIAVAIATTDNPMIYADIVAAINQIAEPEQ